MNKELKRRDSQHNYKTISITKDYYELRYDKQTELKIEVTERNEDSNINVTLFITIETYDCFEGNFDMPLNTRRKYSKNYYKADFGTNASALKEVQDSINQSNLDFEQLGFTLDSYEYV